MIELSPSLAALVTLLFLRLSSQVALNVLPSACESPSVLRSASKLLSQGTQCIRVRSAAV